MAHTHFDQASAPVDPHRPFLVPHSLTDHPLLRIDALLELAKRLPPGQIQYNKGDVSPLFDRRNVEPNGLTPEETIREIERNKSWMVLRHAQTDAQYRDFIYSIHAEMQAVFEPFLGDMLQRECYIIVSSPGSVAPLHMDPEHNVLWHIRGQKTIHMWDPGDEAYLPQELLERFYTTEDHKSWNIDPIDAEGHVFDLQPGTGLHFPLEAPHFVQNGDQVCISISTTWRSSYSRRKESIHQFNAKLRSRGLTPRGFGRSRLADATKHAIMRTGRAAKRVVGGGA